MAFVRVFDCYLLRVVDLVDECVGLRGFLYVGPGVFVMLLAEGDLLI